MPLADLNNLPSTPIATAPGGRREKGQIRRAAPTLEPDCQPKHHRGHTLEIQRRPIISPVATPAQADWRNCRRDEVRELCAHKPPCLSSFPTR